MVLRLATSVGSGLLFALGAITAARLAYADIQSRRDTVPAVTSAARINGFASNTDYFERLAELEPDNSEEWLDAAIRTNPRDSSAWIANGLAAERHNDVQAAELDLLQAARIDQRYLPAWTLTNFYFRQADSGEYRQEFFWRWARRTASLTYDDFRPLLALAHSFEPSPRTVIEKLGDGTPLLRADLDYLVQQGHLDQAQEAARVLMQRRRDQKEDAPRLIALADRQIRAGRAPDALELWNAVSAPLDPDRGTILGNQDLMTEPTGLAFDWRLPRGDGLTSTWRPAWLSFSLSGDQPDHCVLVEQTLPLGRGKRYRLRFEYVTNALTSPTGLAWDLDGASGTDLSPVSSWRPAEFLLGPSQWSGETVRLGELHLSYRRKPGSVPAIGRIELRRLALEVL